MDPNTRLLLYKLVNNGLLESVNGTISTGKEAVVLHANGGRLVQHCTICQSSSSLSLSLGVCFNSIHLFPYALI